MSAECIDKGQIVGEKSKEQWSSLSENVLKYISCSCSCNFSWLTVNEIARIFRVSVPHLSRSFKDDYGITLKRHLLWEKLVRCRFLLKQERCLTVKDIATFFDFCSCDYFIQVFKNYVGITPGRYRECCDDFYGLKEQQWVQRLGE
jgi:AraC-like DNA-binding protein